MHKYLVFVLLFVSFVACLDKSCYCFPEKEKLKERYYDALDDKYYAEKTFPTVSKWLAGENTYFYSLVPIYAEQEYQSYVCSKEGISCNIAKMHSEYNMENVQNALDSIAQPCSCD